MNKVIFFIDIFDKLKEYLVIKGDGFILEFEEK